MRVRVRVRVRVRRMENGEWRMEDGCVAVCGVWCVLILNKKEEGKRNWEGSGKGVSERDDCEYFFDYFLEGERWGWE